MEDFLLRVEHVSKHYSGHTALDDVSLDIPRGSVYGLLGPNGAGKTTLIRIVNRITAPDEGRVLFDGRPLASADVQRIGYLPEERGLYKKMKVGSFSHGSKGCRVPRPCAACGCGSTGSTSRRGGTVASRSCRREWRRRYSSSSRCCTNPNC